MCINIYQLICSSVSCFDNLKVLLNFSEGLCTGKKHHIYKYIYDQNTIQQRTASIAVVTLSPVSQPNYHSKDWNFLLTTTAKQKTKKLAVTC